LTTFSPGQPLPSATVNLLGAVYYDKTATAWTPSTSFTAIGLQLVLPAGSYTIEGSGEFDWSEGTARRKSVEIFNSTDSTQVALAECNAGIAGQMPFHLMDTITIAGTKTFQLRLKVAAVDGAQFVGSPKIWARPVLAIL
jgi:hypothetical protein